MRKKTQLKYESDSDSDSEAESKKMIMKLLKKHSKKHGRGFLDDVGSYITNKKGLASDVLQYGLPSAMGAMGSIGGPAGAIAGKEGGVLLSKKIAKDNDMSRRSQDPFDSSFMQQRDAKQKTSIGQNPNKPKPYDPLTKEEREYLDEHNRNLEKKNREGTLERYDYTDLKRGIIKGNAKRSEGEQQFYDMMHGNGIHIDVNSHNASGSKAKSGMGFFHDLAEDLRPVKRDGVPVKHHGYITIPRTNQQIPKEMKSGEGLRSRKKAKDHVSRRAFDEYIKNEMDRMTRKDLAESRAVRTGKKAKPAGGYGYGLKGSPEIIGGAFRVKQKRDLRNRNMVRPELARALGEMSQEERDVYVDMDKKQSRNIIKHLEDQLHHAKLFRRGTLTKLGNAMLGVKDINSIKNEKRIADLEQEIKDEYERHEIVKQTVRGKKSSNVAEVPIHHVDDSRYSTVPFEGLVIEEPIYGALEIDSRVDPQISSKILDPHNYLNLPTATKRKVTKVRPPRIPGQAEEIDSDDEDDKFEGDDGDKFGGTGISKSKSSNKWIIHVKKYAKTHGCSYATAIKKAKATYKK
jgi:hypothetical protein